MTQNRGPAELLTRPPEPAVVAGMARRVAEVYQHADEDLRHAVHDSLQAGMPSSVLVAEDGGDRASGVLGGVGPEVRASSGPGSPPAF